MKELCSFIKKWLTSFIYERTYFFHILWKNILLSQEIFYERTMFFHKIWKNILLSYLIWNILCASFLGFAHVSLNSLCSQATPTYNILVWIIKEPFKWPKLHETTSWHLDYDFMEEPSNNFMKELCSFIKYERT